MATLEILAHRGWWDSPEERNSPAALKRAFAAGLGVETDLRDCAGDIVISHDPPIPGKCQPFRHLLVDFVAAGRPGTLALNIKADGLQNAVKALLQEFNIQNYFVFDMSIPDTLQWLKAGVRTFARQSEFEPVPAFYDQSAGIWLDAFKRDWFDKDVIVAHLATGKQVAVVSPELHGRDPHLLWSMLTSLKPDNIALCTDRVAEARRFFHAQN